MERPYYTYEYKCFELINGGVVNIEPESIVSYGMDPDLKYPFFITLTNGKEYFISEKDYDKFFHEKEIKNVN